jgi:dolichyl-phosphate beta-glucosyltransferase
MPQKQRSKKRPDLSVVIPAYREEKRIGRTLDELARFLKNDRFFRGKAVEVIVVAAGPSDDTAQVAESKKNLFKDFRLVRPGPPAGKGRDVQAGVSDARGGLILFMDTDLATPLYHMKEFYETAAGNDVVIGTRDLHRHHPNLARRMISNAGNVLFQLAVGLWIEDSQCGFKLFNEKAARLCFDRLTIYGWSFDMEVLAIARVNELKIKTLRINDWRDVPGGTFNEGILRIAVRSIKDLVRISVNMRRGRYL